MDLQRLRTYGRTSTGARNEGAVAVSRTRGDYRTVADQRARDAALSRSQVASVMKNIRILSTSISQSLNHLLVEKMSCLAEMSPVGNRIQLENGKMVFKPSNAEISCRDK